MNFLSPWFLLGAALIAGPILAHLIRRATRQRVAFSAMRFLQASPPKLDRKNRIQHPWLLLMRCLIVAILALSFARPYLKHDLPLISTPVLPLSVVAVLDESASMQRAGLWDAAVAKVTVAAAGLGPNDQFSLLAVSGGVKQLISHDKWQETAPGDRNSLVRAVLAEQRPGWGAKSLDSGLEAALAEWDKANEKTTGAMRKKIVVVSDFTAGAQVSGLAGLNWPKGCEVNLQPVLPDHDGDASLQWLGWQDTDNGLTLRVRVGQSERSTATALTLQLRDAKTNTAIGAPQKITLQPKDKQIVALPVPDTAASQPLRVDLAGDQENFDNTVWAVHPSPRPMTLVYYGDHAANDLKHARFYLERATEGWKDPVVTVVAAADAAKAPGLNSPPEFYVVAGPLDTSTTATLRKKLGAGAFAVVLLNDPAMVDTAADLVGETGWTPAATAQKNELFGQIDFQHPLFSLFADPHYSDFTHIQFWQPQSLKLPAKTAAVVVAKFDDGSPAVIEAPVGEGRVVIWGGDWATASSSWVLSTKFVPWLQTLFERAAGGAIRPVIAEVGDTGRLLGKESAQWQAMGAADGTFVETTPTLPGVYQVKQADSTRWVALEVSAGASKVDPMNMDDWEKMGVPLHAQPLTSATPLTLPVGDNQTGAVLESRQKLWRWALMGVILLLALESIYSLALSRRNDQNPTEATT